MLDGLPAKLRGRIDVCADTGCWVWMGSWDSGNGYGKVRYAGHTWLAHRLVYTLINGDIPPTRVLDHLCRRRRCCNPAHVESVLPRENTRRGAAVLFRTSTEY